MPSIKKERKKKKQPNWAIFFYLDADERARIERAGGEVVGDRIVDAGRAINMSRALGDHDFKAPENDVRLFDSIVDIYML